MATRQTRRKHPVDENGAVELKTLAVYERYVLGTARFMEIPTGDLFIDKTYQRTVNQTAVSRIISGFDFHKFEPPTVNDRHDWPHYRGPRFALIDGQHRWVVAQEMGMLTLTCRLVSVPPEDEPKLFVELNRQRIWLPPVAAFKGELAAGNAAAKEIQACVSERGLKIASAQYSHADKREGMSIACISTVKRIYAVSGYVGLGRIIDIITSSWPATDGQRFAGNIFLGLHLFLRQNKNIDVARLVSRLRRTTSQQVLAKGSARYHAWKSLGEKGGAVEAIADEIAKMYRQR